MDNIEKERDFNLKEEMICDHLVTTEVKKLWKVEMELARQLRTICEKNNIRYFAGGGTLLGAVRHRGFIPWDDDMDFLMLKKDYDRFCEVAPKELREPYCFQSSFAMSRIRNSSTTGCTMVEMKNALPSTNLGIFIDIFPLLSIPDSKFLRRVHGLQIYVMRVARRGEREITLRKYFGNLTWKNWLNPKVLIWKAITLFGEKDLRKKYMNICSKYESKKCEEVGITTFLPYNDRYIWKKKLFTDKITELPFENITVPAPVNYEEYLRKSYGDYHKFVKNASQHAMPIFDAEKPYTEYLEQIRSEHK